MRPASAGAERTSRPIVVRQVTRVDRRFGRLELLGWLNDTLQLDYSKVEDCSDGVGFLQLCDAVLPGLVPLQRVNFDCRSREDCERNLRILRQVLKRAQVSREVDVPALASRSFRYNNELLQWFFTFVQLNFPSIASNYPAAERRESAANLQKEKVLRNSANRTRSQSLHRSSHFWEVSHARPSSERAANAAAAASVHDRSDNAGSITRKATSAEWSRRSFVSALNKVGDLEQVFHILEKNLDDRRDRLSKLEGKLAEAAHARDVSLSALQAMLELSYKLDMRTPDTTHNSAAALAVHTARAIATAPLDIPPT